ncbi:T-cell surface glycoprotein CD1e, membrane-associated [Ochotona princeps]|uniref:T-cell surface glycoprotein CD1e, membrane-associated n=1 Tax=Ochotona princeps TaxID=9978 RepID=UPI00271557BA|nr:T-cell surface glycoprotein CD1e, membrane-associated [Ochotona princeps]
MLLLLFRFFLLHNGLLCHGKGTTAPQALRPHHPAAEEPLAFRVIQISSFANHSWAHNQGSGWLGEIQTHSWDSAMGTIHFLKPWSRGNFSQAELKNFQSFFRLYLQGFIQEVQAFVNQFQFEYPFEIQLSCGCALRAGTLSESFLYGAYQGSDFLSLQGGSWQRAPGAGSRAQDVCRVLNQYKDIEELEQELVSKTCPEFLAGLLAKGKSELEQQVRPEVWLSSGPSPGPGRLLLVCRVSGFYPKPVWVMWMRGEKQQTRTRRGDVLPNSDGTWYLRVTLEVAAGEAAGLACRVKHSSLRGHDIVIPWGGHSILLILMCLAVMVTLAVLVVVEFWFVKQSSHGSFLRVDVNKFASEHSPEDPRAGEQVYLTEKLRIKPKFFKWKTILSQL